MIAAAPPPDPEEARSRVLEELSKSEYDTSGGFLEWLLGHLESWFAALMDGVDTVVHMAGASSPESSWEAVLEANIVGVRNVLEAARRAGVPIARALEV